MEIASSRLLYRKILSGQDAEMDNNYLAELFRQAFHQLVEKTRPASAELFCRILGLMVFDRQIIASEKLATLVSSADRKHCKGCFEADPSDFYNLMLYSIVLLVSSDQKRGLHLLDRLCRSGWKYRGIAANIRELALRWSAS